MTAQHTLIASLLAASVCLGQESSDVFHATSEHEWLKRFGGTWKVEGAGGPPTQRQEFTGVAKCRWIGEFWIVNEFEYSWPGIKMTGVQTFGYDAEAGKYSSTWIDSVMNHRWEASGVVDEAADTLTLDAVGPNMAGDGTSQRYRDIYRFVGKDQFTTRSMVLGEDGKWLEIMKSTSTRVASD